MGKHIEIGDTVYFVNYWWGADGSLVETKCDGCRRFNGRPEWHTEYDTDAGRGEVAWLKEDEIFLSREEAKKTQLAWHIKAAEKEVEELKNKLTKLQDSLEHKTSALEKLRSELAERLAADAALKQE